MRMSRSTPYVASDAKYGVQKISHAAAQRRNERVRKGRAAA
jgi:hypothetical protein